MPPRLRFRPQHLIPSSNYVCSQCRCASLAAATSAASPSIGSLPPMQDMTIPPSPIVVRHPPSQPPSHKRPEFRKTQLHRQYQSLLRSTPLIVIFQHNNLKATEWMGLRRELAIALQKVDQELAKTGGESVLGLETKIHTIQTGIFASALKVVELWPPSPTTNDSFSSPTGLSTAAWQAARNQTLTTGLEPLLSGPLALLTFPAVSPPHLKAALSILSPTKAAPAPRRAAAPGYYDAPVQNAVQKLMLLGARVEGRVMDTDGARWVGGIDGGLDGLRGRLVAMLQSAGAGVSGALEAATRSLYFTVEGRRGMLEEEEKKAKGDS